MKKKFVTILLFFLFFFLPCQVNASDNVYIKDYYMDATVEESGDILVKELILLKGEYNGYDRMIRYINSNAKKFDGTRNSFEGSDIYNGSGLELITIKGIEVPDSYDFNLIYSKGEAFQHMVSASVGMNGVYTKYTMDGGYRYRMYYPSNGGVNGFYIEYRLKDMAILYSDVAEIGWNIFSNEQTDDIDHFLMKIHLPENKNELRAWAHGPLNGNIALDGKNLITVEIDDLKSNTAMDVRFAFDKEQVLNATKKEEMEALPMILSVEQKRADDANKLREQARFRYYGCMALCGAWLIGLVVCLVIIYQKYDKEYKSAFQGKYFRDFPDDYAPSTVGYLFHKKIRTEDLSASILNLIDRKILTFEVNPENKNDYILTYEPEDKSITLSPADAQIISWLFHNKVGTQMTLSQLKKNAKSDYEDFICEYDDWKARCKKEAQSYNFFEAKGFGVTIAMIYALLGFPIGILSIANASLILLPLLLFGCSIGATAYLSMFTKRTKKGNESYAKWKGLKNFLNDFGKFEAKELPQVTLWNKYLVYAVTFGCAEKLIKTMKIKVEAMGPDYVGPTMYYDYYYMNSLLLLNRTMNRSINSAVNTAISTRAAAQSANSSGGGFGGGFSSGGGSFGGGGGGGHF